MSTSKKRLEYIASIDASMHRIGRVLATQGCSVLSKSHTFSPQQWFVISLLFEKEEVTIKDVAQYIQCSSSAATQLINGLVKKKCVIRKKNIEDKRSTYLVLSAQMKKDITVLKQQKLKTMSELFHFLNDKDIKQFAYITQKLVSSLS